MLDRTFYVYILASGSDVLYVGVTNDLRRRMWEHTRKINDGFAAKYGICRLVYYEPFDYVQSTREAA